ncbi:MAG: sensor histidine kinase [Actinobacteria bacterium]|nr:sensor histidine kinase [Actinomycetota bacterium]
MSQRTDRRADQGRTLDLSVAARVAALQLVGTFFASRGQVGERKAFDVVAFLLLAAGPAALVWRRRRPDLVVWAVVVTTVAYYVLDYPYGPAFVALVVALYSAVTTGYRVAAWVAAGAGYLSYLALDGQLGPEGAPSLTHAGAVAGWFLVVLVGSEVGKARRERAAEEARSKSEEARRRASEERLRIARELHDVVAHNISLINVQAGVALHLIDEQPNQARTALAAIKQASKEALGELRSVLDVLRQGDDGAPRAPAPGLDDLDDLVGRTRAAGLEVHVEVDGTPGPLGWGVELAAYRIVQEALTNVARHAGPAVATVRVTHGEGAVVVEVDDNGKGPGVAGPSEGGNGLSGMRERVAALGGRFEAGARPEGGFRVRAWLPVDPQP